MDDRHMSPQGPSHIENIIVFVSKETEGSDMSTALCLGLNTSVHVWKEPITISLKSFLSSPSC